MIRRALKVSDSVDRAVVLAVLLRELHSNPVAGRNLGHPPNVHDDCIPLTIEDLRRLYDNLLLELELRGDLSHMIIRNGATLLIGIHHPLQLRLGRKHRLEFLEQSGARAEVRRQADLTAGTARGRRAHAPWASWASRARRHVRCESVPVLCEHRRRVMLIAHNTLGMLPRPCKPPLRDALSVVPQLAEHLLIRWRHWPHIPHRIRVVLKLRVRKAEHIQDLDALCA